MSQSTSSSLLIGFWNCRGLDSDSFKVVIDLLSNDEYDLIFLIETWFMDHAYTTSSSYFFISSKRVYPKPDFGRWKSGLACYITPKHRQAISYFSSTEYSISLTIYSKSIQLVYFPPTMSLQSCKLLLPKTPISLLLGDINTHFGKKFGSKNSGPAERSQMINDYCEAMRLVHLIPQPPGNTPDHAFVNYQIDATWKFKRKIGKDLSDHSFMEICLPIEKPQKVDLLSDSLKFNLKPLENPIIQLIMVNSYEKSRTLLTDGWVKLYKLNPFSKISEVQSSIDFMFYMIVTLIHSVCDEVLGSYTIHQTKSTADYINGRFLPRNKIKSLKES
ncbi:hypothetical protein BB559_003074 [Furculomyces boomerangus]|uniref:Endonuclease/exonuclease/phosphatase domain-containing protein n=1 Tax=Furculomyces boomerangus TaxID=61424 RepID=A0A2T9YPB7_9FUNG|nr:hypothetical protein BB559_003074 [Furculomyces boomerangus]